MFNNTGNTNVLFNNATTYSVSIPSGPAIVGVSAPAIVRSPAQ